MMKEVKINNPTILSRFPIIIDKNQWDEIAPILNKMGYTWMSSDTPLQWNPWDGYSFLLSRPKENKLKIFVNEKTKIVSFSSNLNLDEVKINNPTELKFPLIVNYKEWLKLIPRLKIDKYKWVSGHKVSEWNPWDNFKRQKINVNKSLKIDIHNNFLYWDWYDGDDNDNVREVKINTPFKYTPGQYVINGNTKLKLTSDINRLRKFSDNGHELYLVDDPKSGERFYIDSKLIKPLNSLSELSPIQVKKQFGDTLFGDNKALAKLQNKPVEPNTEYEESLYKKLINWLNISTEKTSKDIENNLDDLLALEEYFPEILEPPYGHKAYRGTSVDAYELREFIKNNPNNKQIHPGYYRFETPYPYSPKRKISSWTTKLSIAFNFGGSFEDPSHVPVVFETNINEYFIMNPQAVDAMFKGEDDYATESEVFHFNNKGTYYLIISEEELASI